MSIIKAYKSDSDGKLFEHKADYDRHLRMLARERKKEEKKNQEQILLNEELLNLQKSVNLGDLIENVLKKQGFLYENAKGSFVNPKHKEKFCILHIEFAHSYKDLKEQSVDPNRPPSLEFYPDVSCSHSAPRGKLTNFGGSKDRPTHYPGVQGHIHIWSIQNKSFEGNVYDVLKVAGINTGGGNGFIKKDDIDWPQEIKEKIDAFKIKNKNHTQIHLGSYDVKIFALDYPDVVFSCFKESLVGFKVGALWLFEKSIRSILDLSSELKKPHWLSDPLMKSVMAQLKCSNEIRAQKLHSDWEERLFHHQLDQKPSPGDALKNLIQNHQEEIIHSGAKKREKSGYKTVIIDF